VVLQLFLETYISCYLILKQKAFIIQKHEGLNF